MLAGTNLFRLDQTADLSFVEIFGLFEDLGEYGKHSQRNPATVFEQRSK